MSLFACSNKKINSIEKENIFLSIFWISIIIFYFYFDSLLVYLHVLLKKIIYYGFSKDNITFEYSSLFNDDTCCNKKIINSSS